MDGVKVIRCFFGRWVVETNCDIDERTIKMTNKKTIDGCCRDNEMQECRKCGVRYEAPEEIDHCFDCTWELWNELLQKMN